MLVPINMTGGTYKHKSLPLSAQVTRNFWPQLQQIGETKSDYILESFPGKKLFGTSAGVLDRGMFEHLNVVYKVTDTTLYTVDANGTHTSIGTIPGAARCIFTGINTNVVIVTEGTVYYWNGTTVSIVTDSDLESPNSASFLNSQVIYDGDNGRFVSSDVGDATSISGLNYATAESNADDLIRTYVHDETLYLLGDKTIEPWQNTGIGNPPFDRIPGATMSIGLGALHSVANSNDYMYMLANNNQIIAVRGSNFIPISTIPLAAEISNYPLTSDAIGNCYNIDGQWFYEITFPNADKTFVFPENGQWFELSSGTNEGRNLGNSYCFAFRKNLVADHASGDIYELDAETYTENGAAIVRTRDTQPLHSGLVRAPGKSVTMNRFELIMEVGVGLLSGQGINPEIMLSTSDDGGFSFSTEMTGTIGRIGQYLHKVEWFCLGSFESRIVRVRVSDPVYVSIHSAAADIEVCI